MAKQKTAINTDTRQAWSQEHREFARKGRALNALKLVKHIEDLQVISGRSRRECRLLVLQCLSDSASKRAWNEEEAEQVRDLLVSYSIDAVARKVNRSVSSIKSFCHRDGISVRTLRSDLLSIAFLAKVMKVRREEIQHWIDQGWLKATQSDAAGKRLCITPEALHRCLRVHRQDLQERKVRSTDLLNAYRELCHVSKHTEGEQLLDVRESIRLRERDREESGSAY